MRGLLVSVLWEFLFIARPAWAAEEIHDVRPPVALPPNFLFLSVLLILIIAVGSALLFRYLIRQLRHPRPFSAPSKTAWDIAYERLAALQGEQLPQRGFAGEFYSRLSLIIRYYMEDRFLIRAPEMTTEEFLASLKTASELTDRHKQPLREFLNFSDMVKFARQPATVAQMEEGFALAKRLVDETKVVPVSMAAGDTPR